MIYKGCKVIHVGIHISTFERNTFYTVEDIREEEIRTGDIIYYLKISEIDNGEDYQSCNFKSVSEELERLDRIEKKLDKLLNKEEER